MPHQLKLFKVATATLLLLNLVLLAVIFLGTKPDTASRVRAHEHFGMDEAQREEFRNLADAHRSQMRGYNKEQRQLLKDHFGHLSVADNSPVLSPRITELEQEKINSTYHHFVLVKALLRPEQQAKFPEFVEKTVQQILGQGGRKKRSKQSK